MKSWNITYGRMHFQQGAHAHPWMIFLHPSQLLMIRTAEGFPQISPLARMQLQGGSPPR